MVLAGLGLGLLMQVRMLLSQNGVGARDMGVASSTAVFFQTIGGSLGVALFGAVFTHRLADASGASVAGAAGATIDPATLGQLSVAVQHLLTHAITQANQGVFVLLRLVSSVHSPNVGPPGSPCRRPAQPSEVERGPQSSLDLAE